MATSTSSRTTLRRPIPSDATLVWLASERAAPLFRTLDRAKAFGPLVALLAMLPAILATFTEVLSPVDAAWGLRALDVTGAALPPEAMAIVEAVCPGELVRPGALRLSAAMMRLIDPSKPISGSIASLSGGVFLIGATWLLAKSLSGRRFAFWTVVLAAFHPTLTALLLYPVPVTVALALAALALWGHSSLDRKPLGAALAWAAVVSATALGLWLVGTPALLVPAVIAADAGFAYALSGRTPAVTRPPRGSATLGEILVRRLSAVLAGILVWAVAEQVLTDATPSIATAETAAGEIDLSETALESAEVPIVGPLWGLAAIGTGRLFRIGNRRAAARSARPVPRLLLVWLIAAGVAALSWGEPSETRFDPGNRYFIAFASLPLLAAAAYGIEEAARRTVSGAWVLLAVSLPLAVRLGSIMASLSSDGPAVWVTLAIVAAAVTWLVAKVLPAVVPMPGLRRGVLMGAILTVIAVDSSDGLAVLFRPAGGDDVYGHLRAQLAAEENIDAVVLLADASAAPELVFALRSSKPHAVMEIAPTWDEASIRLDRRLGQNPRRTLAAVWGLPDTTGAAAAEELRPIGEPLLFKSRELLLYLSDGAIESVP
ncbi:MAG: hypothetical protein M3552_11065 [Planctomycetota bacterium]|nr:hypothetical protein [Planctomycetota bacterium]